MRPIVAFFDKLKTNRVVRNFSILTFNNFFSQFIVLLASIKIARTLGPANFGIYTFLIVQCMLFASIGTFGLRNIQIRSIARRPDRTKLYFFAGLTVYGVGFIFSSVLVGIYSLLWGKFMLGFIVLVLIEILAINLWDITESVWFGHQRMSFPSFLLLGTNILWVIVILSLPRKYFNVQINLLLYVLFHLMRSIINFISIFKAKLIQGKIFAFNKIIYRLCFDSFPYYANMWLALPTNFLTNNFLEVNSNATELGYFNTNKRISQPLTLVVGLALAAIFPNISDKWKNDRERFYRIIKTGFGLAIVLFGYLAASISIFRRELVLVLFGKDFLTVAEVVMYQIWFVAIFGLFSLIGVIWGATDKQKLIAVTGLINSIFVTPFLWIGSKGGAISLSKYYLLSYVLFSPFLWWYFIKSIRVSLHVYREIIFFTILLVSSIIMPTDLSFIIKIFIFLPISLCVTFYIKKRSRDIFK
jgi:O-antigen/teichoic acid export membrane protein